MSLLFWIILLPFIGGILCWLFEKFNKLVPRYLALFIMLLILFILILIWLQQNYFSSNILIKKWQIIFIIPWITSLGINFALAIDGLSLLMIILTTIMGICSILISEDKNKTDNGSYYCLLMWVIAGSFGIFMAIDLFLFFFFWEIILIPLYFLIINWGHEGSEKIKHINAAVKFFIYNQTSGLILLISIIILGIIHYKSFGSWSFLYNDLLNIKMSIFTEYLLMIGFFIAFAIKIPLIPFHGWMIDVQEQSPTSGSIDISGIIIKTATYGLLRFNLLLFPKTSMQFAYIAIILSLINIFYGSWLAFKQKNIKRFISYSNLSHIGFIVIAIYSNSIIAYHGAVFQMISSSLSSTALVIISTQLYEQTKTRNICKMGGLWGEIMYLPALSLFFATAILGIPGTGNFIGEIMILFGTFKYFKLITIIMTLNMIFTSIYALWMIQQIYYGTKQTIKIFPTLNNKKIIILFILAILLILLGFYPQPILNTLKNNIKLLQNLYPTSI